MYNMISTRQLTPKGDRAIRDLAQHYGVSVEAVRTLLFAVSAGGGTLAQFDHPELGGSGQWMSGGMTMVGDMYSAIGKSGIGSGHRRTRCSILRGARASAHAHRDLTPRFCRFPAISRGHPEGAWAHRRPTSE